MLDRACAAWILPFYSCNRIVVYASPDSHTIQLFQHSTDHANSIVARDRYRMSNELETAELRARAERLRLQLEEITTELQRRQEPITTTNSTKTPPPKSGYLFKWQDRDLSWGGSKWDLRNVALIGGQLSYKKSHLDAVPRYVLSLRNCAVRDDGCKRNKRHTQKAPHSNTPPPLEESGAYFHVFSIYNRTQDELVNKKDATIIPLLRFSTQSLPEKEAWIQLLSEHIAFADLNPRSSMQYLSSDPLYQELNNLTTPIIPSNYLLNHRPGTLPPLYFVPPTSLPNYKKNNKRKNRYPSGINLRNTVTINKDADASSSHRKGGEYPPSKPMHHRAEHSYLSYENPSLPNYRGLLNLAVIILIVSNFRILLGTMNEYGSVFSSSFYYSENARERLSSLHQDRAPLLLGFALSHISIVTTFLIEWFLSHPTNTETHQHRMKPILLFLHAVNISFLCISSLAIVWFWIQSPILGAALCMSSIITTLKLISYVHANADYRSIPERSAFISTWIQDLEEENMELIYPKNVTLKNIYYFWLAPTLTYQVAFPRLPRIDGFRILSLIVRLIVSSALILFLIAQVIQPNLDNMIKDLEHSRAQNAGDSWYSTSSSFATFQGSILANYILKLAIASTYIWLLVFYAFFHVFLNLMAEVLRFGDRLFYKDWWNSSTVESYWRFWNQPVHYWLVRHLYFPCIRLGCSKAGAMFVVFLLSAIVHEVLISVPFHLIRPWSFLGMMAQIPLVFITKYCDDRWPGSSVGNIIFWISFCIVGQPMAVLMYAIDYWQVCDQNKLLRMSSIELGTVGSNYSYPGTLPEL